ncbi:WD repeat-containing protein 3-like protein, partial [Nibea albiflora]
QISTKAELRSRLAELQLQLSGPQQTLGIVGDGKKEKMKRQVEDAPEALPSQTPPASKILKGEEESKAQATPAPAAKQRGRGGEAEIGRQRERTEPADVSHHCRESDNEQLLRQEARSLSVSDKERFILSGSADCYVKIWALNIGQCVKSIYTFNAVTALCFVPEEDGYIITGSDGGKVQAWSWHTFQNCQSINAHQEAVTSIQSQGPLVFSGSAEGGVSVWENRCSDRDPLRPLHHWSGQVTGCRGEGGRLTLSPRGDRVFLAHGRAWLKILHWRTGTMSRLTNHSSITGVTDCVHQIGGLLIGSCYDLANGESSLNLFSLPQCRYLTSLTWPDAPRILCFAAWTTGSGDHRWVTGGHDLIVWEKLPNSGKQNSISPVARLTALRCLISLLLVALVTQPSTCNRDDSEGDEQVDALSVQLSVTAQVTPTPLWAVVWGPTQPLEDETYHFLSSQETDPLHHHGNQQEASTPTSEDWPYPDAKVHPGEEAPLESRDREGAEDGGTEAEETEPEEGGHQEMHMKDF